MTQHSLTALRHQARAHLNRCARQPVCPVHRRTETEPPAGLADQLDLFAEHTDTTETDA